MGPQKGLDNIPFIWYTIIRKGKSPTKMEDKEMSKKMTLEEKITKELLNTIHADGDVCAARSDKEPLNILKLNSIIDKWLNYKWHFYLENDDIITLWGEPPFYPFATNNKKFETVAGLQRRLKNDYAKLKKLKKLILNSTHKEIIKEQFLKDTAERGNNLHKRNAEVL